MTNSILIHRNKGNLLNDSETNNNNIVVDNCVIDDDDGGGGDGVGEKSKNLECFRTNEFIVTNEITQEDLERDDVPNWYNQEERIDRHQDDDVKVDQSETFFRTPIVWRNIFTMTLIHVLGLYGWWWSIWYAKWQTMVWAYVIANLGGIGVLVGAHRLWTHRSFKARWPLRVVLMIAQTIALQNDIYEWVRDHRVHHKYSETDADPHNSRRGFFFAHVGWLLCRKHPDVKRKGAGIDMSDVWADPIVRFQRRFYIPLVLFFWGIFPISVPVYFWGENLYPMIIGNFFRYTISLHHAWLVNSAAHIYGYQFFDRTLRPRENYMVTYLSLGEGYHNYHHTFPWDYSASEHGWKKCFNVATLFIDLMAWFGLAYDRKIVSREVIEQRAKRTGDLSIIPPLMNEKRQPVSVILDFISGMLVSSWILWVTFILSHFLRT